MNKLAIGLGGKFLLLLSAVLAGGLLIAGFLFSYFESKEIREELNEKGEALGRFAALISSEPLLTYDFITPEFIE